MRLGLFSEIRDENSHEYKLWDLLSGLTQLKEISSVNYKTELSNGFSLHPVHKIAGDGLITKTIYYFNYIDENNTGEKLIEVFENYELSEDSIFNSQKSVVSRTKTWNYFKKDGSSQELKKKTKKYDTFLKKNSEGVRRRKNITSQMNTDLAVALIYTGESSSPDHAAGIIISAFDTFEKQMTIWERTGGGYIYDAINNDDQHNWLDNIVPNLPETQAIIPHWVGKTIRNNINNKLQGAYI